MDIANRIKELRISKGYSQEELSRQTQLNIRTIQRIENGDTEPRGDTLIRLANVFGIPQEELSISINDGQENKYYIVLLSLSVLTSLLWSWLGIITPLCLWLFMRDKIKDIDVTAKRILNFQITWGIILFLLITLPMMMSMIVKPVAITLTTPEQEDGFLEKVTPYIFSLYLAYNPLLIVLVLYNVVRTLMGRDVVYQPAIPFLRTISTKSREDQV